MPILWPLKVPEKANAITQRKHVCLYFIRRTTQLGNNRFFLISQKNLYSNQATQKNTYQIFVPKKILRSSPSLEIPSTPLGIYPALSELVYKITAINNIGRERGRARSKKKNSIHRLKRTSV